MSFGIPVRNGLGLGLTPSTTLSSGRTGPRPALTLNFLTSTALSSNVTFSRGTQATLTDSTGKITYAPNNLLTNSESFENSSWTKTAATITSNVTTAPDGTSTADKLTEDSTTAQHFINGNVVASNMIIVYSIYAKAAGRTIIEMSGAGFNAQGYTAKFNLANGTMFTNTGGKGGIVSVGNGWYRCYISFAPSTGGNIAVYLCDGTGANSYTGNGTDGVFIWGAQLEQVTYQTTPSTYNSTTPKNLLGYTQEFDNAAWTKTRSFVQTNFLLRSQELNNAAWGLTGATVSADVTAAPDGTTTADRLVETTATSAHFVSQASITSVAGAPVTLSFYLKKGSLSTAPDFVQLYLAQAQFSATAYANYNIATGALGTVGAGSTATITPVGNGWYRCTLTATASASSSTATGYLLFCNNSGTAALAPSYTGATTSDVFVWGAQAVQGATAGDYQPTYAAAAAVQYAAPDGTLSADKLVVNTTAGSHIAFQQIATQQAGTYTFSVYAKAAEISTVTLQQTITTTYAATFDLTNGAVSGVVGGATASATAVGNGWYRCSITYTTVAAIALTGAIYTGFPPNDGTSGIYIWGAQLSNSASLDTYAYNPGAAPTSAAYYGPRFDYDPVTLAPKGLLIEEQRTNLTTYSEQFNNAAWGLNAASATPNVTTAPDGTTSADKLVEAASTATHGLDAPAAAITAGTTYTGSLYAKASERRYLFVALTYSGFTSGNGVCFDLQTGTIVGSGTGSASAGAITPVGNGWYRCSVTLAATVSGTFIGAPAVYLSDTATNSLKSYTGDGTSGAFVWGAQLEAGAFATSYIPTVASTVTRSADVATMLGTNFSSWYNQTQGAFVVSGDSAGGAVSGLYEASTSGTAAQSISVRLGQKFSYAQGLNRFDFSYTAGNVIRHGFAYLAGNYGAAVGGTALAVNANGQPANVPAGANQLALGCLGSGTFLLNGHIRTLSYYNTRLTNTQLQALTA